MSLADSDPVATVEFTSTVPGFEKVTLTIKRATYETEGFFTSWVRSKAMAACEFVPDPISRKEAYAAVTGEIASGYYDYEYDPTSGQKNYVHESLRNRAGEKHWVFLMLRQENPMLASSEMRKIIFEPLWRDIGKRNEIINKINMLSAPTPQMPPLKKATDQSGAEATPS